MESQRVFVAGGTGYMGTRLIQALSARGHEIAAVVRPESHKKLPVGCAPITGNVLDGNSYAPQLSSNQTFVQLVGVAHPGPAKAKQFVEIDQKSALEAIRVARDAGVKH